MNKAIVLSSGGLDSTTCMAVVKSERFEIYALTFDYGQRHRRELESAGKAAEFFGVRKHLVLPIDLRSIGGSALTGDIDVPKHGEVRDISESIPPTYVPARNIIFLSIATAYAETISAGDIFAGMNYIDYSGYPDCRPEFVTAFQEMIAIGTKTGAEGDRININTPLINLSKKEIIELGTRLGVDYSLTWSCYDPVEGKERVYACGACDSCRLRLKGFAEANIDDPIMYLRQ